MCLDDLKDVIPYDIEGTYEEEPSEEEDGEEDIELVRVGLSIFSLMCRCTNYEAELCVQPLDRNSRC